MRLYESAAPVDVLRVPGMDPEQTYTYTRRTQVLRVAPLAPLLKHVAPVRIRSDSILMNRIDRHFMLPDGKEEGVATGRALEAGVPLNSRFMGTGYNDKLRLLTDFASELYHIRAV